MWVEGCGLYVEGGHPMSTERFEEPPKGRALGCCGSIEHISGGTDSGEIINHAFSYFKVAFDMPLIRLCYAGDMWLKWRFAAVL